MTTEHFQQALDIITSSEATITVTFNEPVFDSYARTHPILIRDSNAAVIKRLVEAGFSLSMCSKGLSVNRF